MRKGVYTKVGYDKFLNAVKRAYRDSHNVVSRFREVAGRKVIRGRAHCVAGVIEDLLAQFLKGAIPKRCGDLVFFVDQPIIIDHARQPRYPDLLICRQINNGYRLLYGAELKANIGWHHGRLHEIVDEAFTLLGQIRGLRRYQASFMINVTSIASLRSAISLSMMLSSLSRQREEGENLKMLKKPGSTGMANERE